jgi:hypothetical protein
VDTNNLKAGDWIETGYGQARIAEFEQDDDGVFAVGTLDGHQFRLNVDDLVALSK